LISYSLTVLAVVGGTLVPAYLALYSDTRLKKVATCYLAAAGLGLTFWFFLDTMGDAAYLDVNSPISPISEFGGVAHLAIIGVFCAGFVALAAFDYYAVPRLSNPSGAASDGSTDSRLSKSLVLIPIAVAAVMGIHGLGEGWDIGSVAAVAPSSNIIDAFGGGWSPVVSYLMHKFLEATIIAAVYECFVGRSPIASKARWHLPVLGLLFGLTSVIGSMVGYYVAFDTAYFYAFGVTSAFYAAVRLAEGMIRPTGFGAVSPSYLGWRMFVAMGIGFFLLYFAALFH